MLVFIIFDPFPNIFEWLLAISDHWDSKYGHWNSKSHPITSSGTNHWSSENRQASWLVLWESARVHRILAFGVLLFLRVGSSSLRVDSLPQPIKIMFCNFLRVGSSSLRVDSLSQPVEIMFYNFLRVGSSSLRVDSSWQLFWN